MIRRTEYRQGFYDATNASAQSPCYVVTVTNKFLLPCVITGRIQSIGGRKPAGRPGSIWTCRNIHLTGLVQGFRHEKSRIYLRSPTNEHVAHRPGLRPVKKPLISAGGCKHFANTTVGNPVARLKLFSSLAYSLKTCRLWQVYTLPIPASTIKPFA